MRKYCAKRVLSLVLSLAMLIGMMSVLTVFGVSAETTIFSGLNADDWDYTAVDGVFYFDSGILYNNRSATTAAGRAITSKETLNLGKQFTASYVLGAKSSTSNYPTEVDYGIAFRVGESLEVLVYHDSKYGSLYNEVTNTTKSIPKAKITYNGAVIYDGVAVKRDDGTTKLATGINNSMTKGTYTVHYENGVLSLVYTLWKVPYEYLYTTAEDGSKTYGINLADLVPDFDASQVIFNDKVSVSLICATAKDVVSLTSFSLSSVPAAPPSAVTNFTVASSNEEYGIVLADENNPVEIVAGDRLTYTAVANEGYRFAGWFNAAGTALAGTPTATFPIYEGTEIYAYFVSSADHTQVAKPNRATILCLGDSITDGYCIASGYRSYLMKQLYAEGAYFDFSAGKYRDDDDVRLPVGYRNHGGLSGVGFKAYGSLKTAITYLDDSMGVANADIALVMLGTNDYSHYADASDYIGEYYRAYIDKLYEQNPNIAVFVASVINQKTMATPAAAAGALNEQLPAIVAEYKAEGKDITFVDMCNLSGLESSNFADAVHPNESGAEKIANVWYNAIVDKVFKINALGDNSYNAPDAVESVTVLGGDTLNVYMQSKNRVQLLTYVTPATAEMTTVTWNSSDDSIAAVDTFGTVTALREGTVTVTATTIDGNVTDSITLNVINSDEPDANTVLFSDNFSTADNWAGDTGIVNTGAKNIFANYANATKTISTFDTFLADQFRLHFVYRVYGNNIDNHSGKYTEVSFGGYALRFGDCARTIDVYKNGVKLANIVTGAANTAATEYDMIYFDGTLYIAINSVIIAQITDVSAPVESNITVVANEQWRASYISNLYLTGTAVSFGFKTASLTLEDNLSLNFKVPSSLFAPGKYTEPFVEFKINDYYETVRKYTVSGEYYVFTFTNIAPQEMNDIVTATLYAKDYEGTLCSSKKSLSARDYCYYQLNNNSENETLRKLIVDLLNYGAEAQKYTSYNTGALVNKDLTSDQAAWGTTSDLRTLYSVKDTKYAEIPNPSVTWKAAGLKLDDSVVMRFTIQTDDIFGLTVKVTDEKTGDVLDEIIDFKATGDDGFYYVYFDGFNAGQMSESVLVTVYNNIENVPVSHTIRYSIESYAHSKLNTPGSNVKLESLLTAMMKYGDAAAAYKRESLS